MKDKDESQRGRGAREFLQAMARETVRDRTSRYCKSRRASVRKTRHGVVPCPAKNSPKLRVVAEIFVRLLVGLLGFSLGVDGRLKFADRLPEGLRLFSGQLCLEVIEGDAEIVRH